MNNTTIHEYLKGLEGQMVELVVHGRSVNGTVFKVGPYCVDLIPQNDSYKSYRVVTDSIDIVKVQNPDWKTEKNYEDSDSCEVSK